MKGLALNKKVVRKVNMPDDYQVFLTYKGALIKSYSMMDLIERQLQDKLALPKIIYNDIVAYGLTEFTFEQIDSFLQGKVYK